MSDLELPPPADPLGGAAVPTIDEILARKKRPTRTVSMLIDGDTGETVDFTIKGISRKRLDALRAEHPPTKEQRDEFRRLMLKAGFATHQIGELTYNPDTFPPVLLAECVIQPAMTVDKASELWDGDEFVEGDLADLFDAAMELCVRNQVTVLGKGSRRTTASPPS